MYGPELGGTDSPGVQRSLLLSPGLSPTSEGRAVEKEPTPLTLAEEEELNGRRSVAAVV